MADARRSYLLGLMLVTLAAVAWSTSGFFTRLVLLDSWTVLVWRGIFAALGLFVAALGLEGRLGLTRFRSLGLPGLFLAVVGALASATLIISLKHTTVAHVAVIYATVPFVGAGLAWLVMREVPSREAVLASLAALSGIAVMVGLGGEGGIWGDLMALGNALSMAVIMVVMRRFPGIPSMQATVVAAMVTALFALPLSGINAMAPETLDALPLLALFGVVSMALGSTLFILGAKYLPVIETALISSLESPLAPIWVWLAFGETPGMATLIGGSVVFAAVFAHVLHSNRSKSDPRPALAE
jgi:drug/metabolite transporter (DMT)-like permease